MGKSKLISQCGGKLGRDDLNVIKLIKEMRPSTQLIEIQHDLLMSYNLLTEISIFTVSKNITGKLRMSYKKLTAINP